MQLAATPLRALAIAAALCATGAAHAALTFVTSGTTAPFNGAPRDTFSDLSINSQLPSFSVTRTIGNFSYVLSSTLANVGESGLYVVPAASTVAVSTSWFADSLVFTMATPVRAFGGNFFATNILGEVASGGLTLIATDVNGLSASTTITGGSLTAFTGVLSDVPLSVIRLSITAPNTSIYASADNIALSPVPEPQTWAMLLAGGTVMLQLAARRKRK